MTFLVFWSHANSEYNVHFGESISDRATDDSKRNRGSFYATAAKAVA